MIYFLDDFKKYGAIPDINTKNKSFIKMALLYKRLNVKNHLFPLALLDRDLIGYDPHNLKDPSAELRFRICQEAKLNVWYFLRECVRIPASGSDYVPYQAHRANIALTWSFYNNIDTFATIPRQKGKTIATQCIVGHLEYVVCNNFIIGMFTKDSKLIQENVERLKNIRDGLPDYMIHISKDDTDNKEGLSYTARKNKYLTLVARADERGADSLGRGHTLPVEHWDEFAYMVNNHITYPAALAATDTARENAKKNGLPHANIITTTAGMLDSEEGRYAYSVMSDAMRFSEKLYDCRDHAELEAIIRKNSRQKMLYITYSFLQLGSTLEWFKEVQARSNASQDQIDKDYLNIWKMGSTTGVISQSLMRKMNESIVDPVNTEVTNNGYIIRWYVDTKVLRSPEYKHKSYILGMDSSEAIGRDYTSLVMIDPSDMSVIMTCKCNEANIILLANSIADLLIEFDGTVFVPERNSTGCAIIDSILVVFEQRGINPFTRIYNSVVQEKSSDAFKETNIHDIDLHSSMRKHLGFRTTSKSDSRNLLYKIVLMKTLELNACRIFDAELVKEICALTVKNGRIDHVTGGHDDSVIAYLLACYLCFFGKNLHYYGIDQDELLKKIDANGNADDSNPMKKEEQLLIRKRIARLENLLRNCNSDLVKQAHLRDLNELKKRIDESVMLTNTISVEKAKTDEREVSGNPNTFSAVEFKRSMHKVKIPF